ncbi:MAG TPA: PatB family C-S lyase [Bacteroidales bacterium]|nr:PatB family C-S lyase [Bacteroidales bacterium]HRX95616.1 PatB family C-S lyase [Bacteroidales bacterium]
MKYNFDEIIDRTGTSCVKWDIREMFFKKQDVLPMWVADMDFKTPDFIVDAVKQRAEHPVYGYTIRPESYYTSLINWIDKKHRWKIDKDWVIFSPGIVPAVNMAVMAYTKPGDKIIVQPPVYFPFFGAVKDNGRQLVNNQLKLNNGRFDMDFEDLEKQIDNRTRMIIISNPHNPGGSAWTKEELTRLGEICIKHNLILISDEIHSDLAIPPNKHTVAANLSKEIAGVTVTMMAPSKTFNLAGMASSSVIISNEKLRNDFQIMLDRVHVGMGNLFGMVASEAAYTHGEEWLNQMLIYVKGNIDFMEEYISKNIPKVKMIRPEATYMVWLDFRELAMDNDTLKQFIIEKARLGLNDGPVFGPGGEGFQRINLACPRAYVEEAMNRLENAIKTL